MPHDIAATRNGSGSGGLQGALTSDYAPRGERRGGCELATSQLSSAVVRRRIGTASDLMQERKNGQAKRMPKVASPSRAAGWVRIFSFFNWVRM
jgi:hypothetical protein